MTLTANPAQLSLSTHGVNGSGAKFLRIMKLTTIIILATCLYTSAESEAQQTITFSGKEVSLEYVFNAIKKQTNYRFFFNTDMLSKTSKVTIDVKNAQVEQVMNMALKDQPLTFTIKGRTIFIMKKPEEEKKSTLIEPTGDPITVSGRVTDENGQPLGGANVKVKGGKMGVTTDTQGRFTLNNVDQNATLEVSYVGRETKFLPVKGKSVFSIALGQRESVLDETVVIAYGTTNKRFNTGNVVSVKAADIEKQPVNNPLLALAGRVPGLEISQSTGFAGSGVKVRIQGVNSINSGNDPLYVIDGIPFISQLLPSINTINGGSDGRLVNNSYATYGNPLSFLNPSDIESIEVLKDADATAIYGSQAANGAILITTKKGKTGEQKIEFNMQHGWGQVTQRLDLMDRRQYLDMRYEALKNDGIELSSLDQGSNYDLTVWDTTFVTDWQKELIGNTSHYTDMQATVSGGNSNNYYSIGTGYHRETVVIPGDFNDQRGNLHFQLTSTSSNQKFKLQFIGNYLNDINKLPNSVSLDLTDLAVTLPPVAPQLYNPDGTINWAYNVNGKSTWDYPGNPLAQLLNKNTNKTNNLIANLLLGYQLLPKMRFKTNLGYNNLESNEIATFPIQAIVPELRANTANGAIYGNNNVSSWIIEPQINYERKILKGNFEALIGGTIQERNSEAQRLHGSGYISDNVLDDINAASTIKTQLHLKFKYKYSALFARFNFKWVNKYILNLTARRDGSSRFGERNRFHSFGSVATAWIFSEEKFISKFIPFLSFGKLKVSYGTTGSDQIGEYQYLNTYSPVSYGNPYQGINTLQSNGLSNPYLQWEETRKFYMGFDLGFFNNRILFNGNFYRNRSSNQLISYKLPVTTGFGGITRNFSAIVQNTGFELSLSTQNIEQGNFKWSTNINITLPKNELISFPGIEASSYTNILIVGKPITILKKFHFVGVDPNTGLYYFDSKTNPFNPQTPDDAKVIVNTSPIFYGGLENSLSYKGFQLDFLFQFVKQSGSNFYFGRLPGASQINQPTYILDRWKKSGDITSYQKFNSDYSLSNSWRIAQGFSDAGFKDASYVRLKNVSISYQLSSKFINKMHILGLKVFSHAQNLLTFTNYKGLDPETRSSSTLPPLRILTVGFQAAL